MSACRSPAMNRYLVRLALAMAAYLITLALGVSLVSSGNVTGAVVWLLAILPGLSIAAVFWAFGRLLVEETDEYQRWLLVRQSLIATGFTLPIVTIWGFLENFGLVQHVDAFYVAVLWFFGLGLGSCWNGLVARRAGHES